MELVEAGTYTAKAVDYGIAPTKAGRPQAVLVFEFKDHMGATRRLTWYGHFTDATAQRTVESLVYAGLKGNDPRVLVNGPAGNGLDPQEVSIVVVHEQIGMGDKKGQTVAKVLWVNASRKPMARMSEAEVVKAMPDFSGLVSKARKESGVKAPAAKAQDFGDI